MMNVPLTNAVLQSMPPKQSGVASALLNASREVAGLLGLTIIGAVLRSRQGAAARHGANPAVAYLDGYHSGLLVTVTLIAFGALISYGALRRATRQVPAAQPVLAAAANPGRNKETAGRLGSPLPEPGQLGPAGERPAALAAATVT